MQSKATTVREYLSEMSEEQRALIEPVRAVVHQNLPAGMEERMGYGMITWVVPRSIYPAGYHCDPKVELPYASLGVQKHGASLYLMTIYGDEGLRKRLEEGYVKAGKKLKGGKSCINYGKAGDVALEVVGEIVGAVTTEEYIRRIEAVAGKRKKK